MYMAWVMGIYTYLKYIHMANTYLCCIGFKYVIFRFLGWVWVGLLVNILFCFCGWVLSSGVGPQLHVIPVCSEAFQDDPQLCWEGALSDP